MKGCLQWKPVYGWTDPQTWDQDQQVSTEPALNLGHSFTMYCFVAEEVDGSLLHTVKILKFGTPQTIAIIVLKLVKFDVTLH